MVDVILNIALMISMLFGIAILSSVILIIAQVF